VDNKIIIVNENEAFVRIICEDGIAYELREAFTFQVPGYQFTPQYKARLWDGKIRLFDVRSKQLYRGLVPYVAKFCEERNYDWDYENEAYDEEFSLAEANEFVEKLRPKHAPREYQLDAFVHAIRTRRSLLLSPTASGKSLIIYLLARFLSHRRLKKGLIIVPTVSLVEQLTSDFKDYSETNGWNVSDNIHKIYQGQEKDTDKFLTISTWQSIYKMPKQWFAQFDFVIGDEAHQFKAKSLIDIMSKLHHAKYRFGFTGTLDGTQTHKWVLEGLFGPSYKVTRTYELMEQGHISQLDIRCLVLKHSPQKFETYEDEIQYLIQHEQRNKFITNLSLSLEGNTLILFSRVEAHGAVLYEKINNTKRGDRKVFFIHGGVDTEEREMVREITERENNAIIVASYGTFSTGINIKNLHNVIFASPSKSRIRNLQSIGRVLRKGKNKTKAVLYDIADDCTYNSRKNYTLNHLIERIKIYNEENFNYEIITIQLKKK
jgi:superfamily II DNA or RNA helicase